MKYKNVNRAENYWVFNARVLFALVQLEFLGRQLFPSVSCI